MSVPRLLARPRATPCSSVSPSYLSKVMPFGQRFYRLINVVHGEVADREGRGHMGVLGIDIHQGAGAQGEHQRAVGLFYLQPEHF